MLVVFAIFLWNGWQCGYSQTTSLYPYGIGRVAPACQLLMQNDIQQLRTLTGHFMRPFTSMNSRFALLFLAPPESLLCLHSPN